MTRPIFVNSEDELRGMREAGRLASRVLKYIDPFVTVGVTTKELNDLCYKYILDHNGIPAPLEQGFPTAVCTSVNHVVCHGIPGDKPLRDGILSI